MSAPEASSATTRGPTDPLIDYLRGIPPLRLGHGTSMSMVSVRSVVEACIRAAQGSDKLRGRCYALKDFDANFFQFYQEAILGRQLLPLVRIPAVAVKIFAWMIDLWFLMVTLCLKLYSAYAGNGSITINVDSKPSPWMKCLLVRHPMLSLTLQGVTQALVDLTVDDSTARADLGEYGRR
eukprot:TRINITY_DN15111_c0_g1_i2.p1 TRINITY_DN15111_c0_g1~~TRINITY_DN15111_c0_g1_i2.p1  ORF type:complete len:210 (-),score=28.36 TRINITY_DN15111_c0_g1_i2:21-560(-)